MMSILQDAPTYWTENDTAQFADFKVVLEKTIENPSVIEREFILLNCKVE